jgi:hypothetical protein
MLAAGTAADIKVHCHGNPRATPKSVSWRRRLWPESLLRESVDHLFQMKHRRSVDDISSSGSSRERSSGLGEGQRSMVRCASDLDSA